MKPDFGPMMIETPIGMIENADRERNTIKYLLEIIGPTCREDGGPSMDTLEGAAYRVKCLVEKLRMN